MPTRFRTASGCEGGVVEELEGADLVDALAQAAEQQRDDVVDEARVDARDEDRRVPGRACGADANAQILGRGQRVVQWVDRGRDDVQSGSQAAFDVVDRLGGPEVARRAVGDRVRVHGKRSGHVVGRTHSAGGQSAQLAGVPADLGRIRNDHARQLEGGIRENDAQRRYPDVARAPDDHAMWHAAHLSRVPPTGSRRYRESRSRRGVDAYEFILPEGRTFAITNYLWHPETYLTALRAAGFRGAAWHPIQVSPEGRHDFAPGFWDDLLAPGAAIGVFDAWR